MISPLNHYCNFLRPHYPFASTTSQQQHHFSTSRLSLNPREDEEDTLANNFKLQQELYESLDAYLETEGQGDGAKHVQFDKDEARDQYMEQEKQRELKDTMQQVAQYHQLYQTITGGNQELFLLGLSKKSLETLIRKLKRQKSGKADMDDSKLPEAAIQLRELSSSQIRTKWRDVKRKLKADSEFAARIFLREYKKEMHRERNPEKYEESPIKVTGESFKTEVERKGLSSMGSGTESSTSTTKKFDPNILSAVKARETEVKSSLESSSPVKEETFSSMLSQLKHQEKSRKNFALSRWFPFLRTQRNRNIAQAGVTVLGTVGYFVYYFSNEEWLPKRVTTDDLNATLQEIRDLRAQYEKDQQSGGGEQGENSAA